MSEKKTRRLSGRDVAREILLTCINTGLTDKKERISGLLSGKVDWKYLRKLADSHKVSLLIAYHLISNNLDSRLPKTDSEYYGHVYNGAIYRNILMADELDKILAGCEERNIDVIALKGTTLAERSSMVIPKCGWRAI